MFNRFVTISAREARERKCLGIDYGASEGEDFGWVVVDTEVNRVVGCDGGEPEDQLLVRDWEWVTILLNEVDSQHRLKMLAHTAIESYVRKNISTTSDFSYEYSVLSGATVTYDVTVDGKHYSVDVNW